MAYNIDLAEKVRKHLLQFVELDVFEKEMFSGLCFLVNEKMCINVSEENLMLRFDPVLQTEIENRQGYLPMIMRGKHIKGYAYISEEGYSNPADLVYWIKICLEYNPRAKSSKKK